MKINDLKDRRKFFDAPQTFIDALKEEPPVGCWVCDTDRALASVRVIEDLEPLNLRGRIFEEDISLCLKSSGLYMRSLNRADRDRVFRDLKNGGDLGTDPEAALTTGETDAPSETPAMGARKRRAENG